MDSSEIIKLAMELGGLAAAALGLASRLGGLRVSVETKLGGLESQLAGLAQRIEELSHDVERVKEQGTGDHVLLGELKAGLGAMQERSEKALDSHRGELARLGGRADNLERDLAFLRGRLEQPKVTP